MARHHKEDDGPETLVGISFDDNFRAQEFLTAATRLASQGHLILKDAVTVTKSLDGQITVHETIDPQPTRSALSGALWTGLIGLLVAGPAGWLAGAAVGAGAGAVAAKVVDLGIPDEWVTWFRQAAEPGRTTVALLVANLDHNALVTEAERFSGAQLVYANLDDVTVDRIRAALGQLPAQHDHEVDVPEL
ncbi:MAG: DUF1269 domain-containing protein [Actinobacteria bacterium]|jgi:uncharacterized membrane protein|nr:MAG: DUF1269 domain-containing protein [Actinomycetota bacterium]